MYNIMCVLLCLVRVTGFLGFTAQCLVHTVQTEGQARQVGFKGLA